MTEPENFEEDLFADLYEINNTSLPVFLFHSDLFNSSYDDNDAPKPAAAPVAPPVPALEPSKPEEPSSASRVAERAQDDEAMQQDDAEEEEDDDDDEVDFNLGGRDSGATAPAVSHETEASTPPFGTVHKASAKDDG